ncbi:hypothetical protein A2160_00760 [Candidatus Beckwithbacteria bacterium RBG_13_42_9]|uniref:Uncharacterized protein n=1 Tax=Candidatus Beckwithbacteria bacterium RBG_13_42_9 TaxID=1797457 RepID=A0A1F5E3E5_9BACT|nr:MAG: hypothetical protein A2160_00760 [Candidatus Beckwithbacteria bacterium RBG_13_42_9]
MGSQTEAAEAIDIRAKLPFIRVVSGNHVSLQHAGPVEDKNWVYGLVPAVHSQDEAKAAYAAEIAQRMVTDVRYEELTLVEAVKHVCPACGGGPVAVAAALTGAELDALQGAGVIKISPKGIVVLTG